MSLLHTEQVQKALAEATRLLVFKQVMLDLLPPLSTLPRDEHALAARVELAHERRKDAQARYPLYATLYKQVFDILYRGADSEVMWCHVPHRRLTPLLRRLVPSHESWFTFASWVYNGTSNPTVVNMAVATRIDPRKFMCKKKTKEEADVVFAARALLTMQNDK